MALFWAFVGDGGYERPLLWSAPGWQWREAANITGPLHLRHDGTRLQCRLGHQWLDARPNQPMVHVCLHEAQAWCNWAGRRLPSEAEWVAAAQAGMAWGDVWEWTSSPFLPFPGFQADPYVEYSAPWFGDHWVLKGASAQTHVALRDVLYRNFYRPHRRDVFAGFRSVALAA
jgi:EgtB-related family protein